MTAFHSSKVPKRQAAPVFNPAGETPWAFSTTLHCLVMTSNWRSMMGPSTSSIRFQGWWGWLSNTFFSPSVSPESSHNVESIGSTEVVAYINPQGSRGSCTSYIDWCTACDCGAVIISFCCIECTYWEHWTRGVIFSLEGNLLDIEWKLNPQVTS